MKSLQMGMVDKIWLEKLIWLEKGLNYVICGDLYIFIILKFVRYIRFFLENMQIIIIIGCIRQVVYDILDRGINLFYDKIEFMIFLIN